MISKTKSLFIFYLLIITIIGAFFTRLITIQSELLENELTSIAYVGFKSYNHKVKDTTIYFVGDIMLDRGVKMSVNKNFNGDYSLLFKNLEELKDADILFGNLEGPISDRGNNVGSKYSFRMNPEVFPILKNAGFDIFSFANNHAGDWNISAFKDTLERFQENNILKTGAGLNKNETILPTIIEKNGIKFGFLGFSDVGPNWIEAKEDSPGILLANDPDFENIINNANKKCDVLIISFHWGEEYQTIHNSRQETLAHRAIDAGANLIIGHHPHVIQDVEIYKNSPIFYSLGNFIFDQYFSKDTMKGMVLSATFENKELKEVKILTSIQNNKYQPEGLIDEKDIAIKEEFLSSNCPKPKKEYEDMSNLNIGQEIGLVDKNYIPKNLIELNNLATIGNICLIEEAKKSLSEMISTAKLDGINIKATSAYRSYNYQENILNTAIKNGNKNASIAIAKPGHSEHQLGTAVDLSGLSIKYASAVSKFNDTPEDLWLRENAYKYGFIQSYPFGKENITGYMYESWHYRYLGVEMAMKIKNSGLTITEFL